MTVLTKDIHSSLLLLRSGGWITSGMAVSGGENGTIISWMKPWKFCGIYAAFFTSLL